MKQITKFDELPEDVKRNRQFDAGVWPGLVDAYNAGLRDGAKREPLAEVPEHVMAAYLKEWNHLGYTHKSTVLAVLNADRASEQPAGQCERCHGAGWLYPHEAGDHETQQRYRCEDCLGTGKQPAETPAPAADMQQLRNVAAWAVHHHAYGGIHDANSILGGNADRRISEAAAGDLGKSASDPNQDCTGPDCTPAADDARCDRCGKVHFDGDCKLDPTYAERHVVATPAPQPPAEQAGEIDLDKADQTRESVGGCGRFYLAGTVLCQHKGSSNRRRLCELQSNGKTAQSNPRHHPPRAEKESEENMQTEMKAGPELDKLVGKALGMEPNIYYGVTQNGGESWVASTSRDGPFYTSRDLHKWLQERREQNGWTDGEVMEMHLYPHYSTDISAAWKVVERMTAESRFGFAIYNVGTKDFSCKFFSGGFEWWNFQDDDPCAHSAPLAICLAALRAVEGRGTS